MASNKNKELEQTTEELEVDTNVQKSADADVLRENETAACENPERTVTIRIPRTKENSGDVFVSVNERSWLIQRGVSVEVPECVAEVLRHQEEMMEESYIFEEQIGHKE